MQPRAEVVNQFISRHRCDRFQAQYVPGENHTGQLGAHRGGALFAMRSVQCLGDSIEDLTLKDLGEQPSQLRLLGRGAHQDAQLGAALGVVPGGEQRTQNPFRPVGRVAGQRRGEDFRGLASSPSAAPNRPFLEPK